MNRIIKKTTILFLLLLCISAVTGCGKKEFTGEKYNGALLITSDGTEKKAADFYEGEVSLILGDDGKAKLNLGKVTADCEYVITGEMFDLICENQICTGWTHHGIIDIPDFLGAGPEMTFIKEGTELNEDGSVKCSDGVLGDYTIQWLGAKKLMNVNGDPTMLIMFDFTNNSENAVVPGIALDTAAFQNDTMLDPGLTLETYDVYANRFRTVMPGVTLKCAVQVLYDENGGPIRVWSKNPEYTRSYVSAFTVDPKNLSEISEEWEIMRAYDPAVPDGLTAEGDIGGAYHFSIDSFEKTADSNGNCIRVNFTFRNDSSDWAVPYEISKVRAYQDGVGITLVEADEALLSDGNNLAEIGAGESISFSCVFAVRTDSPVLIEICDTEGNAGAAAKFELR